MYVGFFHSSFCLHLYILIFLVLQVFTWGHRLVTPKRVVITRNLKKSGSIPLKFHRKERLHVVSIAAGMAHSMALTEDGALFYWISSDPDLRCQQVLFL
jgi:inhibitor of Bruton tyrosine kinase